MRITCFTWTIPVVGFNRDREVTRNKSRSFSLKTVSLFVQVMVMVLHVLVIIKATERKRM